MRTWAHRQTCLDKKMQKYPPQESFGGASWGAAGTVAHLIACGAVPELLGPDQGLRVSGVRASNDTGIAEFQASGLKVSAHGFWGRGFIATRNNMCGNGPSCFGTRVWEA